MSDIFRFVAAAGHAALLEATWSPWRAFGRAVAVVSVVSFDAVGALSETRAMWGPLRAWF